MVMSWIFTGMVLISVLFALFTGQGAALSAATAQGAHAGITLAISMAGSLCLWSGVGNLMHHIGVTNGLAKCFRPVIHTLFPSTKCDPELSADLSGNICANLLGLGNAATPMGIRATKRMVSMQRPDFATDEMCRLIVMNTASIQLIPANVAAVRSGLGCATPFDILPAVWVTSLCSVGVGLLAALTLGRVWRHA